MVEAKRLARKTAFFEKLQKLCENHTRILIVHADHVGSRQMAEVRCALRGKAVLLMGRNTMIRRVLKELLSNIPELKSLIPHVRQNIGLIFCVEDPIVVRQVVLNNRVPGPARQGIFAPIDVLIPAGPTGLDPSKTSFFQALGISTKIVKGQIEIQNDVPIIKAGDKVTASQSSLLQKLKIKPFNYGLIAQKVYDNGTVYDACVLQMTNDDIIEKFMKGVQNVAALSYEAGIPNEASIVHFMLSGIKNCIATILETEFVFPEMTEIKTALTVM